MEFIKFLAVLVKGEQEDKLRMCFKLFAGLGFGSEAAVDLELQTLHRTALVKLLARLPLDRINQFILSS